MRRCWGLQNGRKDNIEHNDPQLERNLITESMNDYCSHYPGVVRTDTNVIQMRLHASSLFMPLPE